MIKNKYRPLINHKLMASFETLKKRTGTSSVPDFSGIDFHGISYYIANSNQFLTFNSIIQSV